MLLCCLKITIIFFKRNDPDNIFFSQSTALVQKLLKVAKVPIDYVSGNLISTCEHVLIIYEPGKAFYMRISLLRVFSTSQKQQVSIASSKNSKMQKYATIKHHDLFH